MEFVCTKANFLFWDGKTSYTVMFCYGIVTWYVFRDEEQTNALYFKKIVAGKSKSPNRMLALEVLQEYLETIPPITKKSSHDPGK